MIGFNRLGLMGRLGNQMFQYASLRGIAKNNGYNWMIPPPSEEKSFDEWKHHQLFNCFEMIVENSKILTKPKVFLND